MSVCTGGATVCVSCTWMASRGDALQQVRLYSTKQCDGPFMVPQRSAASHPFDAQRPLTPLIASLTSNNGRSRRRRVAPASLMAVPDSTTACSACGTAVWWVRVNMHTHTHIRQYAHSTPVCRWHTARITACWTLRCHKLNSNCA